MPPWGRREHRKNSDLTGLKSENAEMGHEVDIHFSYKIVHMFNYGNVHFRAEGNSMKIPHLPLCL